ncbi:hypothetical protein SAMN05661080_05187, partial [Modestobacter sp. DSM 44400]
MVSPLWWNSSPRRSSGAPIEYDIPDWEGNGTGELITLLTSITDPTAARPDELAAAYNQRWEEETGNDQLKTHLRGPGRVLRSRLPELAYQKIWAWLLVHHALSHLITQAADGVDPLSRTPRHCGHGLGRSFSCSVRLLETSG